MAPMGKGTGHTNWTKVLIWACTSTDTIQIMWQCRCWLNSYLSAHSRCTAWKTIVLVVLVSILWLPYACKCGLFVNSCSHMHDASKSLSYKRAHTLQTNHQCWSSHPYYHWHTCACDVLHIVNQKLQVWRAPKVIQYNLYTSATWYSWRPLYKGNFSRSQIIHFPIVLIQFEPLRRGQPLYTKDTTADFILSLKHPLFRL